MNTKSNKSLKFFIVFIVIAVLAVMLARAGFKLLEEKKYVDLQTDLLLIQAKVKVIRGKAEVTSDYSVYVGQKVSDSNNEKVKKLLNKIDISDDFFDMYYILGTQDFENMGIDDELKNKGDSLFVVNYDESEVIYTKGIKVNGTEKYKLSEIVKQTEKKEWILHNRTV